jgi:hypothetical protein
MGNHLTNAASNGSNPTSSYGILNIESEGGKTLHKCVTIREEKGAYSMSSRRDDQRSRNDMCGTQSSFKRDMECQEIFNSNFHSRKGSQQLKSMVDMDR